MTRQVKWYFDVKRWRPTSDDWLLLTSSVAAEELTRINKFVYQDDAKSSLIGRALIRKFVSQAIGRPTNELKLTRSELGRPAICETYKQSLGASWPKSFDFNISHSGDFCALTGFHSSGDCLLESVGVDVTQIVQKKTKQELDRFLDLMSRREFTHLEWDTVARASSDRQKCVNFTRLWCLKESFIKAIGLGLKFKLNRIEFEPSESTRYNLAVRELRGKNIADTTVRLDGELARNWCFLETALDDKHLVAVGYKLKTSDPAAHEAIDPSPFIEIDIANLIHSLTSVRERNEDDWIKFSSKEPIRR